MTCASPMSPFWHPDTCETIVDMGYVDYPAVRAAADRLGKVVSLRGNAEIVGARRLVVRIPPRKKARVLADFPEIVEGKAGYIWCSHGWRHAKEKVQKVSP